MDLGRIPVQGKLVAKGFFVWLYLELTKVIAHAPDQVLEA